MDVTNMGRNELRLVIQHYDFDVNKAVNFLESARYYLSHDDIGSAITKVEEALERLNVAK